MALNAYLTIKGNKQGSLKGQKIQLINFSMGIQSPRDAATGQASGKRQHKPVEVVVPWTNNSSQLYAAMLGDETLDLVTFQWGYTKGGGTGKESTTETIELTNATIVNIVTHSGGTGGYTGPALTLTFQYDEVHVNQAAADDWELTRYSFTYQKISAGSLGKSTTASDDWTQ